MRSLLSFGPVALAVAVLLAPSPAGPGADDVRGAAVRFLASLDEEQRARATFEIEDPERFDWHFVPRDRNGLPLGEMSDRQRKLAHGLLRAALSTEGYLKVTGVVGLERVLRELAEAEGRRADHRDPERYWFSFFGSPADPRGAFAWRFEGHHVSLQWAVVDGRVVAATPAFLGANPDEVPTGPSAGLRVLSAEKDVALALLDALGEVGRKAARLFDEVPRDVLLSPGREPDLGEPAGLALADMNVDQLKLTRRLIETYLANHAPDAAQVQRARMVGAGLERVHFGWAGGTSPGEPLYYRLHGPTFIVEYDNVQNGANHSHTVWRDPERDFGTDLLRAHLEANHR